MHEKKSNYRVQMILCRILVFQQEFEKKDR